MSIEIEKLIETTDAVYDFCDIVDHIDLKKYLSPEERRPGRPRYDEETLLKIIAFAFMENGYRSTREIEKLCKVDIRYMYLLDERKPPTHMCICDFMNNVLKDRINELLGEINAYIFAREQVDTEHIYIDGTKIEANANKYSWVWKKSCLKSISKTFVKITELLGRINEQIAAFGIKFGIREEYAVEYLEDILKTYVKEMDIKPEEIVRGKGHRRTPEQRNYDELNEYIEKLRTYTEKVTICGDKRNSYSKTDHDATFMRVKRDYMGNDQLLPAYNIQFGVCDEYIAAYNVEQYASDMDCFVPIIEKYHAMYGKYPKYPVADAGYGSYNNYLYCEEHNMEKFMKFTMYEKASKDKKYIEDPFRAVNFPIDKNGCPVCPNGKKFDFLYNKPVKGNRYGRTEEYYQCEDCSGCPMKEKCCKCKGNRIIRLNEELTKFHEEVLKNLNCIHGALLRTNRSIQSEGANGVIKWDRAYKRARRRSMEGLELEIGLIVIGFNLHKYHLKRLASEKMNNGKKKPA